MAHIFAVLVHVKLHRVVVGGVGIHRGDGVARVFERVLLHHEGLGGVGVLVIGRVSGHLRHIHGGADEAHQDDGHAEVSDGAADGGGGGGPGAQHAHQHEQRVEEQDARHQQAHERQAVVVEARALLQQFLGRGSTLRDDGVISGLEVADIEDEQQREGQRGQHAGHLHLAPEAAAVGAAPRKQGAKRQDEQVKNAERARDGVVGAGGNAGAAEGQPLGQRAGHSEVGQQRGEHHHDDVVEIVGGLLGGH